MEQSEYMAAKRGTREKVLFARVESERHAQIKSMISAAGSTQDQFVLDAVAEKLERAGIGTTDVGALRGLTKDDRERVEDIADMLRAFGDDECPLLRVAIDHQIRLLREIVQPR